VDLPLQKERDPEKDEVSEERDLERDSENIDLI
jgi:hypothetical protein